MTREPFDRAGTADPGAKSPLARVLEPAIDEARIQSNWHQIVAARAPRKRARLPRWTFALAAAAAAGAAIVYVARPTTPAAGPLASTDPAVAVTPGAVVEAPVALDDGSVVDLTAGARLEVLSNESDRFVTLLHTGRAHFDVRPGGPRRWEIETARATVEVVGTAFVVEASKSRVVVAVERGVVVVRGERVPGRVVRLTAGQHVELDDAAARTADARNPQPSGTAGDDPSARDSADRDRADPDSGGRDSAASSSDIRPGSGVAPLAPNLPSGRSSATRDSSAQSKAGSSVSSAPSAPTATPPARPRPRIEPVVAALAEADQLRAAGDPAGAALVLEKALAAASGSGGSTEPLGLAAFTLGRLYLDQLGAPDKAAAAFAKVIALGTPRSLLEDAYARRIEALVKADRSGLARDALADYDRLYPHGVRRAALHSRVK